MWKAVLDSIQSLLNEARVKSEEILPISMDAQMLGVVPDDESGNPLYNILTWLDVRASGKPEDLFNGVVKTSGDNLIKLFQYLKITGGAPFTTGKDPSSKIIWFKKYMSDLYTKTWKFLDVNGYVVFKLVGKAVINAGETHVTWLIDARKPEIEWSKVLLENFCISMDKLPVIKMAWEVVGDINISVARKLGLTSNVEIIVGSGDVAATALGSGAVEDYEKHLYLGTSDWLASHIPHRRLDVFHAIDTLVSAKPGKYLLVAEQDSGCSMLDYIITLLYGEIDRKIYDMVDKSVLSIDLPSNKILFLPLMFGERVPIDDPYVRGVLFNVNLSDSRFHVPEAIMEGIALNVKWAQIYFEKLLRRKMNWFYTVGGGGLWDSLCQIIADSTGVEVWRTNTLREASTIGAALLGVRALGLADFDYVKLVSKPIKMFKPRNEFQGIFNEKLKLMIQIYRGNRKFFKN